MGCSKPMILHQLPAGIDLLDLHRLHPQRYPVLLESASGGPLGQRDLLLLHDGARIQSHRGGRVRDAQGNLLGTDFLAVLDAAWHSLRLPRAEDGASGFHGGWALLLGYELAAQVEPILRLPDAAGALPVACALRCPAWVVHDRQSGACTAFAEAGAGHWLQAIARDAEALPALPPLPAWQPPSQLQEDPSQRYRDGVGAVREYLAAGDVFQVNLSRGWQAHFDAAPSAAALHARLRGANPAPFAGLFHGGDWAVVSASPERLVSIEGDQVQTRPIAGTRPRFAGDDDASRIRELVGHPKERAEHVMLIDLERNDLGRVCAPGSVRVDELMTVESYAHVHHIVSNVRGVLRAGTTPGAVIRAVFPGGTITGAPKVRCMQIIAELEGIGRGAYTGAMGWLGRDGDCDLNILIRSAELEGGRLRFRTGAGIVIDSDPQRELDETRAKARGMLRALGVDG